MSDRSGLYPRRTNKLQQWAILAALAVLVALPMSDANAATPPDGATLQIAPGKDQKPVLRTTTRSSASGEKFSTSALETLEVLFSDGTSLVLAANSQVTVKTYKYDRATNAGGLELIVESGLVSVSGGTANGEKAIKIGTPHADMELEQGSAIIRVDENGTRANLMNGKALRFTSGGQTEILEKPEFAVSSTDKNSSPSDPDRMDRDVVLASVLALNPGLLTGVAPAAGEEEEEQVAAVGDAAEDETNEFNDPAGNFPGPPPPPPNNDQDLGSRTDGFFNISDEARIVENVSVNNGCVTPAACNIQPILRAFTPTDLRADNFDKGVDGSSDGPAFTERNGYIRGIGVNTADGSTFDINTLGDPENVGVFTATPEAIEFAENKEGDVVQFDTVALLDTNLDEFDFLTFGQTVPNLIGNSDTPLNLKSEISPDPSITENAILDFRLERQLISAELVDGIPPLPGLAFDDIENINEPDVDSRALLQDSIDLLASTEIRNYEFLEWGFFFAENVNNETDLETTQLVTNAPFVIGKLTPEVEIPTTGTASFTGHVAANVVNAGNRYSAVGSYANTWNFGKRVGDVFVRFDGASYAGGLSGNGLPNRDFAGTFNDTGRTNLGRSGNLKGSFFGPSADAVGGEISFKGESYKAEGVFAGEQKK